jgi:hypothetical protein
MGERNQDEGVGLPVEGRGESAVNAAPDAGENVPREARSEEGIPATSQGDGSGDDRAREGNRHQGNPAVGDIGA